MATTGMYRVQTVVTGVAGAPYYCVGYFDAAAGTAQAAASEWQVMLTGTRLLVPQGSVWTTGPEVPTVDPVTGEIVGINVVAVDPIVGTSISALAPRSSQSLISWSTGTFVGGRQIQGRTNIPCLLGNQVNGNGDIDNDWRVALQARVTALDGSPNLQHVVWSKKNGQWQPAEGVVRTQLAVLRSRRD